MGLFSLSGLYGLSGFSGLFGFYGLGDNGIDWKIQSTV